jgi:hypothetical protein
MPKYCTRHLEPNQLNICTQLLVHQLPACIVPVARIPVFISAETASPEFSEERPPCSAALIC